METVLLSPEVMRFIGRIGSGDTNVVYHDSVNDLQTIWRHKATISYSDIIVSVFIIDRIIIMEPVFFVI